MRICETEAEFLKTHTDKCRASDLGWPDREAYFNNLMKLLNTRDTLKYVFNTKGPGQDVIDAVSTVIYRSWGHFEDSKMGITHLVRNLARIEKSPQIFLEGGDAALLCASGPSLDLHLDLVKKAQKAGWLICCYDASLKTLLNAQICPQIVFSTERGVETADLLKRAQEGISEELRASLKKTWLNSSVYLHERALREWPGRVTFHFRTQSEIFYMFPSLKDETNRVTALPHVAAPSLDWLFKRGIKQLILVGQDLCYKDDGSTHTYTHKDSWLESLPKYTCDLNDGTQGETNSYWAEWGLDLSKILASYPGTFVYNMSRKGMKIQGALFVQDEENFKEWVQGTSQNLVLREEPGVKSRDLQEVRESLKKIKPELITDPDKLWHQSEAFTFLGFPLLVRDFCLWKVKNYAQSLKGKRGPSLKQLQFHIKKTRNALVEILGK